MAPKRPSGAEFRKRKKEEEEKIGKLPKIAKFFPIVSYILFYIYKVL